MLMEKLIISGLSINGDSQGVERLFGALSAHLWPGMILKSGDKITEPSLPEKEGTLLYSHLHLGFSPFLFYR